MCVGLGMGTTQISYNEEKKKSSQVRVESQFCIQYLSRLVWQRKVSATWVISLIKVWMGQPRLKLCTQVKKLLPQAHQQYDKKFCWIRLTKIGFVEVMKLFSTNPKCSFWWFLLLVLLSFLTWDASFYSLYFDGRSGIYTLACKS